MEFEKDDYAEYLQYAKDLISNIESGNLEEAHKSVDALTQLRESTLFQELGKLTRELHSTINDLHIDANITNLAESEIPDAKERLEYVITLTEDAANKTLGVVENTLPAAEEMEKRAAALKDQWDRFQSRDMQVEEFRGLTKEIDEFLTWSSENATHVRSGLSDVMMAQGFQDITGQIIRRVISMVQEVEGNLVDLIKLTSQAGIAVPVEQKKEGALSEKEQAIKAEGPAVPTLKKDKDQVVSSQDEVDDLLSSLGF